MCIVYICTHGYVVTLSLMCVLPLFLVPSYTMCMVGMDSEGIIRGLSSDTLHILYYIDEYDITPKQKIYINQLSRNLETSLGYASLYTNDNNNNNDRSNNNNNNHHPVNHNSHNVYVYEQALIYIAAKKHHMSRIAEIALGIYNNMVHVIDNYDYNYNSNSQHGRNNVYIIVNNTNDNNNDNNHNNNNNNDNHIYPELFTANNNNNNNNNINHLISIDGQYISSGDGIYLMSIASIYSLTKHVYKHHILTPKPYQHNFYHGLGLRITNNNDNNNNNNNNNNDNNHNNNNNNNNNNLHIRYTNIDNIYQCIYSGEYISHRYINDDYCDCDDGSDEYMTTACTYIYPPHMDTYTHTHTYHQFFCTSGLWIPTSMVRDGYQDCEDGSDEWE